MKVSVALCTYNGEDFIQEQLGSILNQTNPPSEIVICDDRSKDNTLEIIKNLSPKTTIPIRIFINAQNLGYTRNFEKAVELCEGDVIFLSDQDDVWMKNKIETFLNKLTDNPRIDFLFSNAEIVDENLNFLDKHLWDFYFPESKQKLFNKGHTLELLSNSDVVTGATIGFRSKLKDVFIPTPKGHGFIHDGWFAFQAAAYSEIGWISEPLIKYRQHSNQQCGVRKSKSTDSIYQSISKSESVKQFGDTVEQDALRREAVNILLKEIKSKLQASQFDESILLKLNKSQLILQKIISELNQRIEHTKFRRDLTKARLKGLLQIYTELINGNYFRFSNGYKSILKDLSFVFRK